MEALNEQAWERWKAYRVAIRKPIKPASEDAMKLKLQRYGADQEAVVEQSISNGYQGLFDLKKSRLVPDEYRHHALPSESDRVSWVRSVSVPGT